jgi:hypothetical protein
MEAIDQQSKPAGAGQDITPLVIADLQARTAEGIKKYGEPLRAFNGRRALVDAYQESLDQTQYLKQMLEERRTLLEPDKVEAYIRSRLEDMGGTRPTVRHLLETIDKLRAAL